MTLPPFDGSEYRRTVLGPLRTGSAAAAEDLFWLGHVPRETDDVAHIAARLKETKAFLHKERARPRQADVAAAVLREWPRVEGVLTDSAARRSLRLRLGDAAPGGGVGSDVAGPPAAAGAGGGGDAPADRRRQQVRAALAELARLREEPELAEDLFAFLGLPLSATSSIVAARVSRIADANRRRRPDRERSLTDELLIHARELLVDGDPALYRGWLAGAEPAPTPRSVPPLASPAGPPPPVATPDLATPPPVAEQEPSPVPPPSQPLLPEFPPVEAVSAIRDGDTVVVRWVWPEAVTEVFVSVGDRSTPAAPGEGGRKVTNMKYEIDGGARLVGVPAGALVRVHSGRRDAKGALLWNLPAFARETIAP